MSPRRSLKLLMVDDPEDFLRQSLLEPLSVLYSFTQEELLGDHPEPLHDYRVAIRTLRSRLKFLAPYFAKKSTAALWMRDLSWLDKQVQPLRDAEVQQQLLSAIAHDKLQNLVSKPARFQRYKLSAISLENELAETVKITKVRARASLTSKRQAHLMTQIKTGMLLAPLKTNRVEKIASELNNQLEAERAEIDHELERLKQSKRLKPNYKKMHKLRLKCKRARYLAEAIGESPNSFAKLQTALGDINDLAILESWLNNRLLARSKRRDRRVVMSLMLGVQAAIGDCTKELLAS